MFIVHTKPIISVKLHIIGINCCTNNHTKLLRSSTSKQHESCWMYANKSNVDSLRWKHAETVRWRGGGGGAELRLHSLCTIRHRQHHQHISIDNWFERPWPLVKSQLNGACLATHRIRTDVYNCVWTHFNQLNSLQNSVFNCGKLPASVM